ncbi:MAG: sialidase family protein, partial [bacterium]
VSPGGRVHWAGLAAGDDAVPYQYSDDRGETWSDVYDIAEDNGADREWINVRPSDGAIFVTWRDFGDSESRVAVRVSKDNGMTWSPAVKAADDTRQGGAVPDPNGGAVYLPYDLDGVIKVARSFDDGASWDSVDVTTTVGQRGHIFPVAAVDGGGIVYVVYARDEEAPTPAPDLVFETDRGLEHPDVYLQVSTDKGATWSAPLKLNGDGTTAVFPWIAAGDRGRVVVAWYENPLGTPPHVGQWFTTAAISVDADSDGPRFATTRVSEEPAHTGQFCTSGGACVLTGQDRTMLDFFEVAIHPDGYPVLTWAADSDVRRATISVYASKMTEGSRLLEPDTDPAAG